MSGPSQIIERHTVGITPDVTKARNDVEVFLNRTRDVLTDTEAVRDDALQKTGADVVAADQYREDAHAAAEAAASWVNAGRGVTIDAEPPAVLSDGMVWMELSRVERTPPYPSDATYPDAALYPDHVGYASDGSNRITALHAYDAEKAKWDDFTLASTLINQ